MNHYYTPFTLIPLYFVFVFSWLLLPLWPLLPLLFAIRIINIRIGITKIFSMPFSFAFRLSCRSHLHGIRCAKRREHFCPIRASFFVYMYRTNERINECKSEQQQHKKYMSRVSTKIRRSSSVRPYSYIYTVPCSRIYACMDMCMM